ncbi:hypothetical protein ACIBQ1_14055 [Nonomuraea sp. NPDC050153]|uniref:hypothetical protein n=1 Tax=Nonomuraea sp. NPDC050153 TaxID=3364359 RepID=UPI0037B3FBA7
MDLLADAIGWSWLWDHPLDRPESGTDGRRLATAVRAGSPVHASPDLLAMCQFRVDIIALPDDLFSARNEWEAGNSDNIVQQEKCSWSEGAHHAEQIIAEAIDHFLQAEKRFVDAPEYRNL